ncbi:hypothetical protein V8G54_029406 [Vigna mungo]|uniref:Uncharacterized protein n=1 Tax=Vigna mungo TaxID=3915 RepID=A0AAQ3RMK6_VIGMU
MKSSSISFFVSVRENFSGRSSFSGDPLNFGDFPAPETLLNGENDVPTPAFLSSILTVTGARRVRRFHVLTPVADGCASSSTATVTGGASSMITSLSSATSLPRIASFILSASVLRSSMSFSLTASIPSSPRNRGRLRRSRESAFTGGGGSNSRGAGDRRSPVSVEESEASLVQRRWR